MVEFQKNDETWVFDMSFTKPHNEEESFASKADKFSLCTKTNDSFRGTRRTGYVDNS